MHDSVYQVESLLHGSLPVATRYPEFVDSEEAGVCDELLSAYDAGDEEAARRILNLPLITYMDNVVRGLTPWTTNNFLMLLQSIELLRNYRISSISSIT